MINNDNIIDSNSYNKSNHTKIIYIKDEQDILNNYKYIIKYLKRYCFI